MKNKGWFWIILVSGLVILGGELFIAGGFEPGRSLKITFGFLTLFFFPGFCLAEILSGKERIDFIDQLGWSVVLSLGIYSYPGLLAFIFKLRLEWIFWLFFILAVLFWLGAIFSSFSVRAGFFSIRKLSWEKASGVILIFLAGLLAYYVGGFRGPGHDWDLFNYIGEVRKFLVWGGAEVHHYFYLDAPPDPVHSYDLWALLWSVLAFKNRLDPIPLYIHSVFLTIPLCLFSFWSFARRGVGELGGFFAFSFYYFFQLFYGGLQFLARSSFYPADSMWLLCFPGLLSFWFFYLEKGGKARLIATCFSALGMSIVHILWGLVWYLVLGFYLLWEIFRALALTKILKDFSGSWGKKFLKFIFWALVIFPYLLSLFYIFYKLRQEPPLWFKPIFSEFFLDRLWFYALVFLAVPVFILVYLARERLRRSKEKFALDQNFKKVLGIIFFSLLIALPYICLRAEVVRYTQWESFGRNPYRALITPELFFLNPFKRSFFNPNMSFHPFFWLGVIFSLLFFFWKRDKFSPLARAGFYSFWSVIALVLNPVYSSVFAKFFTLGYLRRILRLPALLGFLFAGGVWERFGLKREQTRRLVLVWIFSALISLALIPAPAEPLYRGLFKKMIFLAKKENRDRLLDDSEPFEYLKKNHLIKPKEVVFSDILTSFRLPAYLGCYVAVQHKPGVGVPDQDERRKEEQEFFHSQTSLERILEILKKRKASWVIINRNPGYKLPAYPVSFGHPETAGKLLSAPQYFEKIYEKDDWLIFRVK